MHGERPLFDLHGIEAGNPQRALSRKVDLKSGGHLIIDQTEAMTTIDVNTGSFVGRRNLEETIFKTNLEAAADAGAASCGCATSGASLLWTSSTCRTGSIVSQVQQQRWRKAMLRDPAQEQDNRGLRPWAWWR